MKEFRMFSAGAGMLAGVLLQATLASPANAQITTPVVSTTSQPVPVAISPVVASPAPSKNSIAINAAMNTGAFAVPVQTPNDAQIRANLRQSAANYFATSAANKADLERRAAAIGAPLRARGNNGTWNNLIDIAPDGTPSYVVFHDVLAADSVNIDNLWPSGSVALWDDTAGSSPGLSGAGQFIGLWDGGAVLTTHEQFNGSRVTQLDSSTTPPVNAHSTAVAGALAAGGVDDFIGGFNFGNWTRGPAYGADVHAYDLTDISGERDVEASEGMLLSSHSYGLACGWIFDGTDWIWNDTSAFQEDWKFGAYLGTSGGIAPFELDTFAQNAPSSLTVYSAGNDRNNGPGGPVTYYLFNDPAKAHPQTATRDWNNGDDGGYDSMNPTACAKNILTVGGCFDIQGGYSGPSSVVSASFSSMGPTDDGRIKPEVVAPAVFSGTGTRNPEGLIGFVTPAIAANNAYFENVTGTSFSAPTVAGGLALVLEQRATDRPAWVNNGYPILSSTLRALAIETADEAGPNPGPDYQFGYGLFDAQAAEKLVHADATATDNPRGGSPKPFVKEVLLPQSKTVQFRARIPSSPTGPLKVTICWNDPAGAAQTVSTGVDPTTKRLVNDLDLRIFPPGTTVFSPEPAGTARPYILNPDLTGKSAANRGAAATTGDDSLNNVEQVVVSSPTAGSDYVVRVTHKGTLRGGQQWVSIIVSGADVIPTPDFNLTATSAGGDFVNITWPAVVSGIYRIQGSSNLLGPYTDVTGDISANLENMSVLVEAPSSPFFWRGIRVY